MAIILVTGVMISKAIFAKSNKVFSIRVSVGILVLLMRDFMMVGLATTALARIFATLSVNISSAIGTREARVSGVDIAVGIFVLQVDVLYDRRRILQVMVYNRAHMRSS
jgi:hypothetical protein